MKATDQHSERVLIYAPTGRDAEIAQQILNAAGLSSEPVGSFPALCLEISRGAGLVVIAEEAIQTANLAPLSELLRAQPTWSDLPIILMTVRGGGLERNPTAGRLADVLGNVTFLERPFHPTTLTSVPDHRSGRTPAP